MQQTVGTTAVLSSSEHVTNILECVLESPIPSHVDTDNMQFGFVLEQYWRCSIHPNSQLGRLKSTLLLSTLKRPLTRYFAPYFFGLWGSWELISALFSLRKLCTKGQSQKWKQMTVSVRGSKPVTFIYCYKRSLSCCTDCLWVILYTPDLAIMSSNLEDLRYQLQGWRSSLETSSLEINVGKTKILDLSSKAKSH